MVKKIEAPRTEVAGGVESLADLAGEARDMQAEERQDDPKVKREEAQQAADQAQAATEAQMVAKFLCKGRDVAVRMADSLDKLPKEVALAIWTDGAMQDIASAIVELPGEHMAWLQELLAKYAPYGALAFALGVPSFVTYEAVRAHAKARQPVDVESKPSGTAEGAAGGQQ